MSDAIQDQIEGDNYRKLLIQASIAFLSAILFILLEFFNVLPALILPLGQGIGILLGACSFAVLAYTAHDIYSSAFYSFHKHLANMNTLIALGTGAVWIFSMVVVLLPSLFPEGTRQLYFESALMIIAFIKLGAVLELGSRKKARQAIERLMSLQPKMARVLRHEEELKIPVEAVMIGDILYVRPGEQLAVDGQVIEGRSSIDESVLTGEAILVEKKEGHFVMGGSVNKTGSFKYRALHVGKDGVLTQIIEMASRAQNIKPPIARLADKFASYFVPWVMVIAVGSALMWFNYGPEPRWIYMMIIFSSVLLMACPCAIGLATPLAVMNSIARAVEKGILIRQGEIFGKMAGLTTLVFDKTGTLTQGRPSVTEVFLKSGWTSRQLLQYAASLERNAEHPLGEAIRQAAQNDHLTLLPVSRFNAIPGYGLNGVIEDKAVLLGNFKLMQERHISVQVLENVGGQYTSKGLSIRQAQERGHTIIYLAIDEQVMGAIALADPVKPEARQAVARLKSMGLNLWLLSGDQEKTTQVIAEQVNIENVMAAVSPHDKMLKIAELRRDGQRVGMVGDGNHDASVLMEADVGLAMSSGSDLAIESGDIVLMRSSLFALVDALTISRATNWNIRQNLLIAVIYNVLSIPLAAGMLYPYWKILLDPMMAGLAMALSSITVVLNASRLRYK